MDNIINVNSFSELYDWFLNNSNYMNYVWVNAKRGKPDGKNFNYIDAVYCALCFGWIDSTCKNIDGITYQKLMPRSKNSHWTYLNVARCKYLISNNLMTSEGLKDIPIDYDPLISDTDIISKLKEDSTIWDNFNNFPDLYKKIRIDNIACVRNNSELFNSRLNRLIDTSRENKMYGNWNDYGRLS